MGIGKRRDGSFYCICDFEGCYHKEELMAKEFSEAVAEAKRLGFRLRKDKNGKWVNFCTKFCEECYFMEPVIIRRKTGSTCATS